VNISTVVTLLVDQYYRNNTKIKNNITLYLLQANMNRAEYYLDWIYLFGLLAKIRTFWKDSKLSGDTIE